jgi:phage repressor protein C with HTH and peptisase S24 domain
MSGSDPRKALDAVVRARGESLAGLSRMLGRNPAYLQQFVTRGSPKRLEERDRRQLANYLGVAETLLGGEEPTVAAPAMVRVPRIDVAASAGPGALVEDDARGETIPQAWLRALNLRREQASFIRARGDSMEPGIADGDLMLVDHDARQPGARGAVFVLRHDGAVIVKRLSVQGGRMTVASDNPRYAALEVAISEVEVIGRVVWLSRALR